jgi:hypothetical protein
LIHVECCLPLVTFMDLDIVVSLVHIKLGEVTCTLEAMDWVIDKREGVVVMALRVW